MTYDDTYSLADKAAYAKSSGMAGCFTWSLDQVGPFFVQEMHADRSPVSPSIG